MRKRAELGKRNRTVRFRAPETEFGKWAGVEFGLGIQTSARRKEMNLKTLEKWNPFRASSSWNPFHEIEEMQNRLASLFDTRRLLKNREEGFSLTEWTPAVDIVEDDKEYTIKAELPGVNKEDVKVTVEGGVLSITGERKEEKEEKDKKYHRIERSYGSFVRSFTIPEGGMTDKIGAEFKNGVLKLHLPKDEKAKARMIDVKIE